MHRIIKRTVTIVTTTILRISWEEDAQAEQDGFPKQDMPREIVQHTVQSTEQFPLVMEGKEVDVLVTEPMKQLMADQLPPDDSYFYQSKKGHEKP
jgi:hypothetical protein